MMGNSYSDFKIIDVTPTLHGSEYASGDLLFNKQEIPNAVLGNGGCSKLVSLVVNSKKAVDIDIVVFLITNNQSIGGANEAMNISAADGAAAGFLAQCNLVHGGADLGNFNTIQMKQTDEDNNTLPCLLQAAAGSTSVYFFASTTTVQTYASADLTFRFGIQLK